MLHPSLVFLALSGLGLTSAALTSPPQLYSPLVFSKVAAIANSYPSPAAYPQYTTTDTGAWRWFNPFGWTSGFFPVTLYELNKRATEICPGSDDSNDWLKLGRKWSEGLLPLLTENTSGPVGHDVGFLSFPFVEELAINPKNATAMRAVQLLANKLVARYDSRVGATRSWDAPDPNNFQVIIDNMMNLEVLFVAEELTGDETYREIAIAHADTTTKNFLRSDGGTYHVVEFNATTGLVTKRRTAQGYADSSTWSRGQAWGIYGFANMYRRTNDIAYLKTARRLAKYFITNIPQDGIVPWDFNAPIPVGSPRPADSSAATLAATALLLLSQQEASLKNKTAVEYYQQAAVKILKSITKLAWKPQWQSLLSNGTVNSPQNNLLTGIVYGDYYYIKAGNELISLGLADCP